MTLLCIGLGIAVVGIAALWLDERMTRQSSQNYAESLARRLELYEQTEAEETTERR